MMGQLEITRDDRNNLAAIMLEYAPEADMETTNAKKRNKNRQHKSRKKMHMPEL